MTTNDGNIKKVLLAALDFFRAQVENDALFRRATELGIPCEVDGQYNRWAFFAVTNMMQSDYGAVLRQYVDGDKLPRLCLQLAQTYLCDPDRPEGATIRRYLDIE